MNAKVQIEQLESVGEYVGELAELLTGVVADGASVGFLPPLPLSEATDYWETAIGPGVLLFVAKINDRIAGSVQLHLSMKSNGDHRAEIAKLMTNPEFRRNGIGRALMLRAEETAQQLGRSLLILDTREGDPSNLLYQSIGYVEAGRIPDFARSANGDLHATVFYYKNI
ncbi:GNAT family N-acetyltransferase [Tumebacillus avium]|uniref:GNAT family N-acetyltransferase n=1 Tax=Tumebacillus avium TaxID=1903704 RepID=A0A1Y0INZ3_9BACL|nr:GNAT family N-acetyltransferase [Tumebacillus avium]ARU62312.1 GNAT family N-acetyltransferase [Tumebacillus avium]